VKCGKNAMTWAVDEELSKFTYWFCTECDETVAWEDESKERDCRNCGQGKGQMLMWDREAIFWYCPSCRERTPHEGPKPDWIAI